MWQQVFALVCSKSTGLPKIRVPRHGHVQIHKPAFISHLMLLISFFNCPVFLLGYPPDLTVHFVVCLSPFCGTVQHMYNTLFHRCSTRLPHDAPFIYPEFLSFNAVSRHTLLGFGLDHVLTAKGIAVILLKMYKINFLCKILIQLSVKLCVTNLWLEQTSSSLYYYNNSVCL